MARKLIYIAVLIAGVASVVFIVKSHAIAPAPDTRRPAVHAMPGNFTKISLGMSKSMVVALVGEPPSKSAYAKFEHKTPEAWAALNARIDQESTSADGVYGDGPSMAYIRDSAEYTHRFHDVWEYKPTSAVFEQLCFGEDGTLLKIGFTPAPKTGKPAPSALLTTKSGENKS